MILLIIMTLASIVLSILFIFLSSILSVIPFVSDMNNALVLGIGYFRGFFETVPYLASIYNLFLIAIVFESFLILVRLLPFINRLVNK